MARTEEREATWRRQVVSAFAAAFTTLVLELASSRFAAFYLSNDSDFLAIPLTLLGLGFGSLHVQLLPKGEDVPLDREWVRVAFATAASLIGTFWVFGGVFPLERDVAGAPSLLAAKTLVFAGLAVLPLYFCGRLLAAVFRARSERIGLLYAADFAGAALGCLCVPLLLQAFGLASVLLALVGVQALAIVVVHDAGTRALPAALGPGLVAVLAVTLLDDRADPSGLVRRAGAPGVRAEQLASRWNAYSRVSLIRETTGDGERFRILHDNAESNVWLGEWRPDRRVEPNERRYITYLPFVIGAARERVLVMFAGVGLQMLEFDRFGDGRLAIDGVELNPAVVELGRTHPLLRRFRLDEFLSLPYATLHVEEGRQFLARTDSTYDVIYAASDAATKRAKIGHSRKYLDTVEAMDAYLRHLAPGGLLVFQSKPYWPKVEPLRAAFERARLPHFADSILILSEEAYSEENDQHHVVVKKGAFLPEEVRRIREHYDWLQVFYAPFGEEGVPEVRELVVNGDASRQPRTYALRPTDDRPHHLRVDFAGWSPVPSEACRHGGACFGSWVKVTTLLVVVLIPLAALGLVAARRRKSVPPGAPLAFLALTGAAYMIVELVFIGKLELLFASPLEAMSLLVAVFLFSNAVGSALVDRLTWLRPLHALPAAVFSAGAGLYLCDALLRLPAGTPFVARAALTVLAVGPAGAILGLFFPLAVRWLREARRARTVPMAYCASVFASVAGASWAMTLLPNVGYRALLWQALGLYVVAAIPAALGRRRPVE